MTLLRTVSVTMTEVIQWVIFNLSMAKKKKKTMKKVILITCALAIGLWSCSDSNETDKPSNDGYVDVTIGSESKELKTIIGPGGGTSWNIDDQVRIIDTDGVEQLFSYASETPQTSAKFTGKLKSGQGMKVYRAYHKPANVNMTLESGHILVVERNDINISENGTPNTQLYGSYGPMIAMPVEFDAESTDSKSVQFHHLSSLIEARVTLRESDDSDYLSKMVDSVVFRVEAMDSEPFYKRVKLDLDQLTTASTIENLDDCITNWNDSNTPKTGVMTTTIKMAERTIRELMSKYGELSHYPIQIYALPTLDPFEYEATVCFYYQGTVMLKMQGSNSATGLNPAGLNTLSFDHDKIVP